MSTDARTTVAIPLHASVPWLDVVEGNLRRLAGHARLVVSDASGADDAVDQLRRRCADVPGITWRTTPAPPGWVEHCNALLTEARTEFFMWLPHDDDVAEDWIDEAEKALDADASAVLAIGVVKAQRAEGRLSTLRIDPRTLDPDRERRLTGTAEIWVAGDLGSLGVAFRGVFRRVVAPPLPQLDDVGSWGDLLWAGELLKRGHFTTINSSYLKRFHPANTHPSWVRLRDDERLRSRLIPELFDELPTTSALRALGRVWEYERLRRGEEVAVLNGRLALSDQALRDTESALRNTESSFRNTESAFRNTESAFRASTSWRVTAPGRALGRALRHLAALPHARRRSKFGDLHDELHGE
jgi:hypothetical protein